MDTSPQQVQEIVHRLERIEAALSLLVQNRTVKNWLSTDDFAKLVGKAEFTVREWCRHGRIRAQKKLSGRGASAGWTISRQELDRYEREGLLPIPTNR